MSNFFGRFGRVLVEDHGPTLQDLALHGTDIEAANGRFGPGG
jgi:hypothetical protein